MEPTTDTPIQERRFTCNDQPVDLCSFCTRHGLPDEIQALVGDMQPGHELLIEDGASILHVLRKTA